MDIWQTPIFYLLLLLMSLMHFPIFCLLTEMQIISEGFFIMYNLLWELFAEFQYQIFSFLKVLHEIFSNKFGDLVSYHTYFKFFFYFYKHIIFSLPDYSNISNYSKTDSANNDFCRHMLRMPCLLVHFVISFLP